MTAPCDPPKTLSYAAPSLRGGRNRIVRALMILLALALPIIVGVWRAGSSYQRQRQLVTALNSVSAGLTIETDSVWHRVMPLRFRHYFDRVREVDLSGAIFDGRHLKAIAVAGSVREVNLSTRPVLDLELAELAPVKNLRVLRLEGAPITDASAPVLAGFDNLQLLDVRDTKLTDASVPYLLQLTTLRDLRIEGSQITGAGARRLRAALPDCAIDTP
jgi:hypothetical protein